MQAFEAIWALALAPHVLLHVVIIGDQKGVISLRSCANEFVSYAWRAHLFKWNNVMPMNPEYLGDLSRYALIEQHDKVRRLHRMRAPLERPLP